jgi:DNA-binding transcriptional ArsR family regulator
MYLAGVASLVLSAPPSFVQLAGHPVRWRLMGELARSDRRVRELARLLDQPQNLVSYHLGRLRTAGLVGARRSTFDARDAYYHLDLANCADSLLAGPGGKQILIEDPAGNVVELFEPAASAASRP